MPDGAHNKVKLNVRVPPNKKQEWKETLSEGETLSSLVRRSVDRETRDEYVLKEAIGTLVDDTEQPDAANSAVTDRLDELQRTVEAFESKLDTLSASSTDADEETVESLAMDILPRLPSYPHDIPEYVLRDIEGTGNMNTQEYIRFVVEHSRRDDEEFSTIDGSVQKFSRELREPTAHVRDALLHLEQNTTENVSSAIIDDTRHWMQGL